MFNDIIVGLQNLRKKLEQDKLNWKLLAYLPIEWRPKVTAIEESKNLKTITMKELLGSLITHEYTHEKDKKENEVSKKKKKKDLALQLLLNCGDEMKMMGIWLLSQGSSKHSWRRKACLERNLKRKTRKEKKTRRIKSNALNARSMNT